MFKVLVAFGAYFFALHVDLNAPIARPKRGILQSAKAGLAHDAFEHHAACDFDFYMQALQFFGAFIVVERKQISRHMVWRKVVREGGA